MRSECVVLGLSALLIVGLNSAAEAAIKSSISHMSNMRVQQCRGGCLEKFAIREALCQQRPECSTSGFPPYNYNSLPDALHLLCWDECAKPPPPKINKSILETWALRTVSMLQQDSLVLVDVAWAPLNTPNQCLVTWEVSGGGLMGNLLTESSNVQLSLWPETKYRVQVTCKNKITGAMSRSLPLAIDTAEAVPAPNKSQQSSTVASSAVSSVASTLNGFYPEGVDENLLGASDSFTILRYRTMNENSEVTVDKLHRDLNMIAIKSLSDIHKPLLLGVVAATLLLAMVICLYICTVRNQRIPSDKKALIDDDGNATAAGATNHFGSGPLEGVCPATDPSLYSRTVHVLTV